MAEPRYTLRRIGTPMNTLLGFALAWVLVLTLSLASGGCSTKADEGRSAAGEMEGDDFSTWTLTDIEGESVVICDQDARGVLLIFASHTCPVANAYAPRIQQVYDEYSEHGIRCLLVQVDPKVSDEQLLAHAREYALTLPVIHDKTHALVRRASAKITPQAVLFDRQGEILYSGRIDDQYVELGVKRRQPSTHDLVNALEAFLAGKAVTPRTTAAVGCYIEDLRPTEAPR